MSKMQEALNDYVKKSDTDGFDTDGFQKHAFRAGYQAAQSESGWSFDMDAAPRDGTWIEVALYYPDLGSKQVKQQNSIVRWSTVVPHWVNNHNYCVDSKPRHGSKSSAYAWRLSDAPPPPKKEG